MSEATRAENATPVPYDLEAHYQELEQKITSAGIPADLGRVRAAFECADRAHSGQKRRDGSPYVSHCIAAAIITAEMGLDEDSIISALLHDTIEDTSLTHDDIARSFGTSVADIVEGVTKLTRVQYTSVEEQQMENMRKMLLAMAKDIRVILIKMADRLHNMRTMAVSERGEAAHQIPRDDGDLRPHRAPPRHAEDQVGAGRPLAATTSTPRATAPSRTRSRRACRRWKNSWTRCARRSASGWSSTACTATIYEPHQAHLQHLPQDVRAEARHRRYLLTCAPFRVIVDTIPDCYNVLGIIHDMYKPLPGRFKDYISHAEAEHVPERCTRRSSARRASRSRCRSARGRCT